MEKRKLEMQQAELVVKQNIASSLVHLINIAQISLSVETEQMKILSKLYEQMIHQSTNNQNYSLKQDPSMNAAVLNLTVRLPDQAESTTISQSQQ
ncbi:unnamed protein product [Didymodactylos carnosus]|uniref:Uncharacterized protein n=1 Tax=Didymodactylos carnosus TaxID=1234261 RepID=A0A8S2VRL2_9BILA|nr:unnamed protein product [Didymodactylos carnosus]CAF4412786.1 unnamed protein product [Didymodactylos carnosus]